MKMRNKGKVHPFISSSKESLSILELLPAAILAPVSALPADDRQVLAYMLTRSLQPDDDKESITAENPQCSGDAAPNSPALFDCDCFHCYTSFWHRWDSSPNRKLIHKAIEAFENHLINEDDARKTKTSRRKEKKTPRKSEKMNNAGAGGVLDFPSPFNQERFTSVTPEKSADDVEEPETAMEDEPPAGASVAVPAAAHYSHKAWARKVLPDVMGIFNSRLWRLWNPNA